MGQGRLFSNILIMEKKMMKACRLERQKKYAERRRRRRRKQK